jgi:hypothetical protein
MTSRIAISRLPIWVDGAEQFQTEATRALRWSRPLDVYYKRVIEANDQDRPDSLLIWASGGKPLGVRARNSPTSPRRVCVNAGSSQVLADLEKQ